MKQKPREAELSVYRVSTQWDWYLDSPMEPDGFIVSAPRFYRTKTEAHATACRVMKLLGLVEKEK